MHNSETPPHLRSIVINTWGSRINSSKGEVDGLAGVSSEDLLIIYSRKEKEVDENPKEFEHNGI